MKLNLLLVSFFISLLAIGQKGEEEVLSRMKSFHEAMVKGKSYVPPFIDDSLSYGHSNGWIESHKDFLNNLGVKISYHSFREDSISVTMNRKVAHARFIADIEATMDGKRYMFHLRVLEVWVKNNKTWKLFARQAIKN
jgi:hypothetical protein